MRTAEPTRTDSVPVAGRAPRGRMQQRRELLALSAVALGYLLLQLLLFAWDRALTWDEVVYLMQTTPGEIGVDWGPQRARGIALLVAPLAVFSPSVQVVRWYMMLTSAAGLFLAFRPWLRTVGPAAATGAFVFAASWVGLYFGMEVFPNLPAALATVAAAGFIVDYVLTGRHRALVGVAISIALIALFRPPDSVWLAAALFGAAVVAGWRRGELPRAVGLTVAMALGGIAGWAPWLIEMGIRYGGPLKALAAAKAESASGLPREDVDQYLNLIEGPVRLIVRDPTLTYRALFSVLLLAAVMVVALLHPRRRVQAAIAAAGMAGGLVPYIVLHTGVNLRYLLPAWGLASMVAGIGAVALWQMAGRLRTQAPRTVAVALLVLLAFGYGLGNAKLAHRNAGIAALDQAGMFEVAAEIQDRAAGRPCAFVSEYGFPQIAWATDCIGLEMDVYGETGQCPGSTHSLAALARDGHAVFAMARSELPDDLMISRWKSERMRVSGYGPWRVYLPSKDEVAAGDLPRIPEPGEASVPCPLSRAPVAQEIRPLRIGPRLPDDETIRYRQRRQGLGEEAR